MSVVVTGAAGFIGRVLVDQLVAAATPVVAVDRRAMPDVAGVTVLTADLLARDAMVETALREADAVVHLAGCPGVRDRGADVEQRRERDNVETVRLLSGLVPADVPLVVVSSSSVYGGVRHGRACRETDTPHPTGGYARSKHRAERLCGVRADAGGHALVVRPFTVVGERQRADMALSRWTESALAGEPLHVYGSLDRTRDVTCVREVARGLRALVTAGATGTVNLGSGRPRSLREIVTALAVALGVDVQVRVEDAADCEVADTWADMARFAGLTGFTPHTDLDDVARRFLAARSGLLAVGG
ncbi:MAG TPA: NAD(P)-dependent oxidoreductase [Nocardioidaceae bacterium]|nr:NAD(P)-dependent oxidoreductase [Nocardioidaceae bacterium]